MKRIIPLLLSAALVFSLTACGGSASTSSVSSASSADVSSAPAASQDASASSSAADVSSVPVSPEAAPEASSQGQAAAGQDVLPLPSYEMSDPMQDGIYSVSFENADLEDTEGGFVLKARFYAYDLFDMVDVASLKAGDTMLYHGDNGEELTLTVETLDSVNGMVSINGGMESENGLDLIEEDTCYRTLFWDDYPIYYDKGEMWLTLADDAVLTDSSEDVQAEPVVTSGAEAIFRAVQASDGYWVCTNTTIRVENGVIVEIGRRWVP
ncbi:MAG: lipoprotein [Faecalibacterium sp.]